MILSMYSKPQPGVLDGSVWVSTRDEASSAERVAAGVRAQLIVDLDSRRVLLVGPRTTSAVVQPAKRSAGVTLTGAGVYSIVGTDSGALVDNAVDVDAFIPAGRRGWLEEHATDVEALIRVLCSEYMPDPRVSYAERELRGGTSARDVARIVGMDRRTFVPLFRQQIGLNPKTYEKLVRFTRTLEALRTQTGRSLASIAADRGFADQAHLTREMRALSGSTPSRLARLPSGPLNHLPHDEQEG